jgi:hypothetical protein
LAARVTDRLAAPPRLREWRLTAAVGAVATGWLFGVGAFVSAIGIPVWIVAMVGLEVTIGVALAALPLTRSAALAVWLASATGCIAAWFTYVTAASPWTWTGEVTLLLPAAILTMLWPIVRMHEARQRNPPGTQGRRPSLGGGAG